MIGRMLTRTAAVLLPITASYAQSGLPDRCDNQRPIPFASIQVTHPLDRTCGINGKTTSSANSQLPGRYSKIALRLASVLESTRREAEQRSMSMPESQ